MTRSAIPNQAGRPKPISRASFEVFSWLFMRISGLVLIFMALFHYALTHIINDVAETDSEFVMSRWSNPLWRLYDWMLLVLALFHGLNGLRIVLDDYVRNPSVRIVIKAFTYLVVGVLFALGTITVLTFKA